MSEWKDAERFEVGRVYEHRTGDLMHILCEVETTLWGVVRIGETNKGRLIPCGIGPGHTDNWTETTLEAWTREWMAANKGNPDLEARLVAAAAVDACRAVEPD